MEHLRQNEGYVWPLRWGLLGANNMAIRRWGFLSIPLCIFSVKFLAVSHAVRVIKRWLSAGKKSVLTRTKSAGNFIFDFPVPEV